MGQGARMLRSDERAFARLEKELISREQRVDFLHRRGRPPAFQSLHQVEPHNSRPGVAPRQDQAVFPIPIGDGP